MKKSLGSGVNLPDPNWNKVKYVFNLSIETGVLPDKLKIAHVSPVYKAGDIGDLTHY